MVSKMAEFTIGKPNFGLSFDFFSFKNEKKQKRKIRIQKEKEREKNHVTLRSLYVRTLSLIHI